MYGDIMHKISQLEKQLRKLNKIRSKCIRDTKKIKQEIQSLRTNKNKNKKFIKYKNKQTFLLRDRFIKYEQTIVNLDSEIEMLLGQISLLRKEKFDEDFYLFQEKYVGQICIDSILSRHETQEEAA